MSSILYQTLESENSTGAMYKKQWHIQDDTMILPQIHVKTFPSFPHYNLKASIIAYAINIISKGGSVYKKLWQIQHVEGSHSHRNTWLYWRNHRRKWHKTLCVRVLMCVFAIVRICVCHCVSVIVCGPFCVDHFVCIIVFKRFIVFVIDCQCACYCVLRCFLLCTSLCVCIYCVCHSVSVRLFV